MHAPLVLADADHAVDEGAQLDLAALAALGLAGEQQHALDDLAAALAAGRDLLDLDADVGIEALALEQQLAVADDAAERVVDLVGDAGGQQPDRGELLGLEDLVLERAAMAQIEADQHGADDQPWIVRRVCTGPVTKETALEVQGDRGAVGIEDAHLAHELPRAMQGLPQLVPRGGALQAGDVDAEPAPTGLLGADAQQLLTGAVPGDDSSVGVERVEQNGGLIEDHRLVAGERLGLEHQQTVREAERELRGEGRQQAVGLGVDAGRLRGAQQQVADDPRRTAEDDPQDRTLGVAVAEQRLDGGVVGLDIGDRRTGGPGRRRGEVGVEGAKARAVVGAQLPALPALADARQQGRAREAQAGHDGGAGRRDALLWAQRGREQTIDLRGQARLELS